MSILHPASALDEKVLVLNRLYAAVRVVSARRAFVLLCKQVAEVIAIEDGQYRNYDLETWTQIAELQRQFEPDKHSWIRTARIELAVPKIIRLLGYDRLPRQMVKLNRRNLYARDGSRCQYCGKHFPTRELTIDHVVPRVQGGAHSWENLVCACIRCNARKGGRTPDQAHMKLMRKPIRPKRNPAITLRLGYEKYQSWKAFLNDAYWTVELRD
jgi:5-methylcytosine-specific restriction endonuclease McrA